MTPFRLMVLLLVVGASAVLAYGLFVESGALKLPLIVSSLAVLGISLGLLGFSLAGSAVRAGQTGHGVRAIASAFIGGLCVLAASGSLAAAIVLGILAAA